MNTCHFVALYIKLDRWIFGTELSPLAGHSWRKSIVLISSGVGHQFYYHSKELCIWLEGGHCLECLQIDFEWQWGRTKVQERYIVDTIVDTMRVRKP